MSLVSWLAGCTLGRWCAALEKVCKISESFRGGNNFEFMFEWKLLSCDPAQPRCRGETTAECQSRAVSAAKGAASATLLLPLSRALKLWYSWAWVQEVAQPGLRVWIQDQFLLPSLCLNWMLVLRPQPDRGR